MEWLRFALVAACMLLGCFSFIVGVFGIYRFKFILNRMHSAAILDTMGLFFIVLGMSIARSFDAVTIKLLLIFILLWITSPIQSHLLAKMEYITDKNLDEEIVNDLAEIKEGDGDNNDNI